MRRPPAGGLIHFLLFLLIGHCPLLLMAQGDSTSVRQIIREWQKARTKDEATADLVKAIQELGMYDDSQITWAIRSYLKHKEIEVRVAAVEVLSKQTKPDAVSALARAIKDNNNEADVLKAILKALGPNAADPKLINEMVQLIPGPDDSVGKEAIATLGKIIHPVSIEALIGKLDRAEGGTGGGLGLRKDTEKDDRLKGLKPEILKALESMTGQKHDTSAKWKAWWAPLKTQIIPPGPTGPCAPIPGARFSGMGMSGTSKEYPAHLHPDINIKLRGKVPTLAHNKTLDIIDIDGPTDEKAPRINTLFADERKPVFTSLWDIGAFDGGIEKGICPNGPHLFGMRTMPGEILRCPWSGYQPGGGIGAGVIYADHDSIALKYTCEDNVVMGYTIHVIGIAVEPKLLSSYERSNKGGRGSMPAVERKGPIGRARGTEIIVSIRDTGSCMDVRSRKDWWPKGF